MAELRAAIVADHLQLHYQPRIDLRSRTVVGVEALVRWQHPKRGLIPPDDFIPAAEKTGLIDDLTLWVLRTALFQAKQWHEQGLMLEMAVNVSARSLREQRSGFLGQGTPGADRFCPRARYRSSIGRHGKLTV